MSETWIIYKAAPDAEGWSDRRLMPSGGLTSIIDEWNWSGSIPKVGDRPSDYENLEDPGNGATHSKDSDWVVTEVQKFTNPDSEDLIVVCLCQYQPIAAEWVELKRGLPVEDMLQAVKA
jgi:hypothetical protein